MNIQQKPLPKSQIQLIVELTPEEMEKYKQKALKEISEYVKVPGFRPGHVPYEILKEHVNEDAIISHTIDKALPFVYSDAVIKEKIEAIARPAIKITQTNPLQFEATIAVYPKVTISGYDKLDIAKNEIKVEEKEIDEVMNDIQKRTARYQSVDRPAQKGDKVEIDFEGFDEGGALLENTKSKNHPLIIGEGTLVQEFEDQLPGMKVGEKKTFKITFPEDYFHKPFQNKVVEFKIEMKKVEEVILPEWNSEFIKNLLGEEKTVEELRSYTRENLTRDKEHQEKVRRENAFLEKITELVEVELPDAIVEEEIDGMIDEFKSELSHKGITFELYLEQTKKELKDLREDRRKEAEKRLKVRFALQQMFKQENMEITAEELEKEIEHIVNLYPNKEHYKIRKEYSPDGYLYRRLENKLKIEKLFAKFLK